MATVAVEQGGQLPVTDQIAVGPDDDRLPGRFPPEFRSRAHRPRGTRPSACNPSRVTAADSRRSKYCPELVNPRVTTRLASCWNSQRM